MMTRNKTIIFGQNEALCRRLRIRFLVVIWDESLDRDNSYIGNVHSGESEATAIDLTESETPVGVIVFC